MNRLSVACIVGTLTMWATALAVQQRPQIQPQQSALAPLAFEVATIKLNVSGGNSSTNSTNGFLQITNQTLRSMIQRAYNVRDFQIFGGPGWIGSDRYDVLGKPENGAHAQQMMQMLQTLLSDRFQLRFHRETREGPVYELFVEKNGRKLQLAKESISSGTTSGRNPDTGLLTMKGTRQSAEEIAADLSARVGRPVINKTGLTDKYDFELSWVPDLTASGTDTPPPAVSGPSFFTAVQEQLGLRLESKKGPVQVLVIDHVSRLQEN